MDSNCDGIYIKNIWLPIDRESTQCGNVYKNDKLFLMMNHLRGLYCITILLLYFYNTSTILSLIKFVALDGPQNVACLKCSPPRQDPGN